MGGKHHSSKQTATSKHRPSQKHPRAAHKPKSTAAKQPHHYHHQQQQQQQHLRLAGARQSIRDSGGGGGFGGGGGVEASALAPKKSQLQENLSFCGCGFLGIYHVGVASCFHEYAPQLSLHKIAGSSAGALVAVAHMCGNLQLAYATTDILRIAIDARARALGPLHPSFDINAVVTQALERGLPDDVHARVSGKLHISLTRLDDLQNVVVSKFDSKQEVIQALICSCFIPCWSGFAPPKFKGVAYIDGGFSNNLLVLDDKTVTVSPFAGEADICPQDDVYNLLTISISNTSFSMTPHNLYRLSHALIPPPPEVLSELCERGFADGIRFLQRMKLISCTRCLEIRSSLLVTTTTNETEIIETETTIHSSADYQEEGGGGGVSGASTSCSGSSSASNSSGAIGANGSALTAAQRCDSRSSFDGYSNVTKRKQKTTTTTTTTTTTKTTSTKTTTTSSCSMSGAPVGSCSLSYGLEEQEESGGGGGDDDGDDDEDENENDCDYDYEYEYDYEKYNEAEEDDEDDTMVARAEGLLFQEAMAGHDCDECILRRKNALRDPLPELFTDRIREACDNVNKSLYNWFYSHRPIKYLSYLAAPYYLPMNISLALLVKYGTQLPYFGAGLYKCLAEMKDFMLEIARRLYERSTTSLLMSSVDVSGGAGEEEERVQGATESAKSSISVKITTDCQELSMRSMTSYECCLTIVLFGPRSLLASMQK